MDKLVLSDIQSTILMILQLFTEKLREKVESVVKAKYGFGLMDKNIRNVYPHIFEKNFGKYKKISLKNLIDIVNDDFKLFVNDSDPCIF